jgi:flavodoxin
MKKILVICYSRSGFTRKIAERIAEATNADLEFIEDLTQRYHVIGYLRGRTAFEVGHPRHQAIAG